MRAPLALCLLLLGCEAAAPAMEAEGVGILMDLRSDAFWDAPFPSEHRRTSESTVDMSGFPRQDPPIAFVEALLELAEQVRGFGTTSGIVFRAERGVDETRIPTALASLDPSSPVFLVGVDPKEFGWGVRVPVDVRYRVDGGPYGGLDSITLLPFQGRPLRPGTLYAAVILRDLGDWTGAPLAPAPLDDLLGGIEPWVPAYRAAVDELRSMGVAADRIAGLAVFRTQDPGAEQRALLEAAEAEGPLAPASPPALEEVHPTFCVYRGDLQMPVFQAGEPPFLGGGGAFVWEDGAPALQAWEPSRLFVTVPRVDPPPGGFPTAVFARTGGGGDRPLIDRGVRGPDGEPLEPGSGPARELAAEGWAGVQVDGPHGGPRNVTEGDEQLLMFNVTNPAAMRDNVRQSAVELALLPELIAGLSIDTSACPGAGDVARFDTAELTLFGHSMGATIAPATLSTQPRYRAAVLSGAGGSWIHNVVHKLSPLETRPLAEGVLGYDAIGRRLDDFDPALSLLQWVGESADPPVHAAAMARASSQGVPRADGGLPDVLMFQGVVDTYILPPMANALSASLAVERVGPALDEAAEWPGDYRTFAEARFLAEYEETPSSVRAAVLSQHAEDGVEDGHEVMFQLEAPKEQYRCFLRSLRAGVPVVPAPGVGCEAR